MKKKKKILVKIEDLTYIIDNILQDRIHNEIIRDICEI